MGPPASMMYAFAAGCALAYAVFTIAGGVMGYVRKGSKPSLIAGSVSGVLLLACSLGDWLGFWYAAAGAIVIGVLLAGRFVGTYMRERVLSAITHAHAQQHFRYQTIRQLVERTPPPPSPTLASDDPTIRPMTQYTLEDFLR